MMLSLIGVLWHIASDKSRRQMLHAAVQKISVEFRTACRRFLSLLIFPTLPSDHVTTRDVAMSILDQELVTVDLSARGQTIADIFDTYSPIVYHFLETLGPITILHAHNGGTPELVQEAKDQLEALKQRVDAYSRSQGSGLQITYQALLEETVHFLGFSALTGQGARNNRKLVC
jgi:hypothetical protein